MVDVLELVGAVPPEPEPARGVDAQADPGPPAQTVLVTGDRLHLHLARHAGHPLELLGHPGRLESALRRQPHVLEVAAATAPGTGIRAGGSTRSGEAPEDLGGIGTDERRRGGGDARNHPFPRQRVTHEDDPPVGGVRHAPATAGDVAHLQLQELAVGCARHEANTT